MPDRSDIREDAERALSLRRLRDACREVANQYDEFGTVYPEALDALNAAEVDFWKATEPSADPEEETAFDRAMKDAYNAGRAFEAERNWERENSR